MNDLDNYRNQALRIISGLEERLGIRALKDARDLVECNEAPIGLSIAAGLIAERNLTVPMWIVEDIKRLLQEWPRNWLSFPKISRRMALFSSAAMCTRRAEHLIEGSVCCAFSLLTDPK